MISKTIAEQMDQTREMTRFYLSQLKAKNPYKIHVISSKKIKSHHLGNRSPNGYLKLASYVFVQRSS